MNCASQVNVAINGLSGFASTHHRVISLAEQQGLCRLIGYCDHFPNSETSRTARSRFQLDTRAVPHFSDVETMLGQLGSHCDLVMLPSPIHIHAHDHCVAVERNVPCYLEKPPTLDPEELKSMIELDRFAVKPTRVGFHYMANPQRLHLKERMVRGEFDELEQASMLGLWPRTRSYYKRSDWPGRLTFNGQLLLDSVFGNAMAHFFHGLLFWANQEAVWGWSRATDVEAALYRAHQIEESDTLFAEVKTAHDITLRFAVSHASASRIEPIELLHFSRAKITYEEGLGGRIEWKDGRLEILDLENPDLHYVSILEALRDIRQDPQVTPRVSLADCGTFVDLNALFYIATPQIYTVPARSLRFTDDHIAIERIEEIAKGFVAEGRFPNRRSCSWAQPPGRATANQLSELKSVVYKLGLGEPAASPD
ncbi:MAG TPA: Gfo/Idh/MocA family oxidoreductase [Opitutaceae bacterium]|nr:Gfo/Idh/MocA family oxidoreductase [Opitutaceae bacterium]